MNQEPPTIPHQPEAELSLMACLLMEPERMGGLAGRVKEDWFYSITHKQLWQSLHHFHTAGLPFDPLNIIAWARSHADEEVRKNVHNIEKRCGDLVSYVPTTANFDTYFGHVEDAAMRRRLMRMGRALSQAANDTSQPWKAAMDEAEAGLYNLREIQSIKGSRPVKEVVCEVVDTFEARHRRRGDATMGVPTGFADIDRMINGFQGGQLVTIGARPAMGKTALLWNFVEGMSIDNPYPAKGCFYSLEMKDSEIVERALLGRASVDFSKGRTGMFSTGDFAQIKQQVGEVGNSPLYTFDGYNMTIGDMCAQIRSDVRRFGIQYAAIDYGQLLKASSKRAQKEKRLEVEETWELLKGVAKTQNIPIILLAQCGRGADDNPSRPPQLKDLQESSAIEKFSDIVAFIHRVSYYVPWQRLKEDPREEWEDKAKEWEQENGRSFPCSDDDDATAGQRMYNSWAQFILAKQRNGAVGPIDLIFHAHRARFSGRTGKIFSNNLKERQH